MIIRTNWYKNTTCTNQWILIKSYSFTIKIEICKNKCLHKSPNKNGNPKQKINVFLRDQWPSESNFSYKNMETITQHNPRALSINLFICSSVQY